MKIKTIILARGGSKGIPDKNIIDVKGKPLLQYSIDAALGSKANDVWVSTDSNKIGEVAMKCGARVIPRPYALAQDKTKSEDALLHFAEHEDFEMLVFLQPTSPFVLSKDIDLGIDMMVSYDSVFSAYREHWIPRWNLDETPSDWDIYNRPMRQDVPEKWVENGALYITMRKNLLESKLRYSGKIGIVEMPLNRSFQIDTWDDLQLVRRLS